MIAFVKIKGGGRHNHGAMGQDVRVYLIDENGVEHSIALTGFTLTCGGRREKLLLTATMVVDEVELDGVSADLTEIQKPAIAELKTLVGLLEGMRSHTWMRPSESKIEQMLERVKVLLNPTITMRASVDDGDDYDDHSGGRH